MTTAVAKAGNSGHGGAAPAAVPRSIRTSVATFACEVPGPERKERAQRLRAAGDATLQRFLDSQVGTSARVLVEKEGFGHSEHFAPVTLAGGAVGEIVEARITGTAERRLTGVAA